MTTPLRTVLGEGRYELGEVLGRGGMAQVRSGVDTLLGRRVAVKLFDPDLDEAAVSRARLEVQTHAALRHPGLVEAHDAGTSTGADGRQQSWLVMELVDGPTLAASDRLEPARLAEVGAELADALAYVHAQGVVHRDVKPANILLGRDGRPKLADFGVARLLDSARQTGTGLTIGTAPYLSPEQVTGTHVGPPADVYALGLVLLEQLTGHREYGGTPVECAVARLHRPPAVPAHLPAPWPALLAVMTARDPAARPSAADVAQVLRGGALAPVVLPERVAVSRAEVGSGPDATALTPIAADAPEPVGSSALVPAPRTSRGRAGVLTGGLLALLAAGGLGLAAHATSGAGAAAPPGAAATSSTSARPAIVQVAQVVAPRASATPAARRTPTATARAATRAPAAPAPTRGKTKGGAGHARGKHGG